MNSKSIGHNPPKAVIKFFNLLINFVIFQLIVSGICPFMWKSNSSGSEISASLSYIWVFVFTVFKAARLAAIAILLSVYSSTGALDNLIETLGTRIPDAVTFLCALLIAIRWNEIKVTIHRIRSYEAEYLDPQETLLALAISTALLAILSVCLYHTAYFTKTGFHFFVKMEGDFCAINYRIFILQTSTFFQSVYFALYALSLMSVYILAVLFSVISLIAGRLCYRIKQCLSRSMEDEIALSRVLKDHFALCNLINNLSQQCGSFFMLFYIQLGLHILILINGIADRGMGMSAGMQMQSGITVILLTVILTLCMIYTSEQADVSQEIQDLADQATDHEKRLYYYGCLHRVTYKPSGFSLGGIVVINRPFVATIVGVLFTYGTFILQLKESSHQNGSSWAKNVELPMANWTKLSIP